MRHLTGLWHRRSALACQMGWQVCSSRSPLARPGPHARLASPQPAPARAAAPRPPLPRRWPACLPQTAHRPAARTAVAAKAPQAAPEPGQPAAGGPSPHTLEAWQACRAVLLSTSCLVDAASFLQGFAQFKGAAGEPAELLEKLAAGKLSEHQALRQGLAGSSAADVRAYLQLSGAIREGAQELASALAARGKALHIHAPGLRPLAEALAAALGVAPDNILEAETGASAVESLRRRFPYDVLAVVGSRHSQLQAAAAADVTVALQPAGSSTAAAQLADWRVTGFADLAARLEQHTVAFIGSGAWATAAAKLAAENVAAQQQAGLFHPRLRMWVYEEQFEGRNLSELINERHENVKYLPGVKLPEGLVACPDLEEVARGASLLVICTPHQFVYGICKQLRGVVNPSAAAISLTKGMRVRPEGPQLISEMVRRTLGLDCCVLMGANIAEEVAAGQLSEGTIGYTNQDHARLFQRLFESDYYITSLIADVAGAEMAGSLKNVVALAAGFVDGLGGGANPKATVIRQGLLETKRLSQRLYPGVQDATFLESCGVADLVATCYGGRNRRVAEAFVRATLQGQAASFDELEASLLKGQKLQGVLTSNEVQQVLRSRGWEADFPLFTAIHAIQQGRLHPREIYRFKGAAQALLAGPAAA